jgi:hypothetical protein
MIRHLRHGLVRRKRRLTIATLVLVALALAAGVWAGGGAGFTRATTSTTLTKSGTGTSTLAAGADTATTSGITLTATLDINFKDAGLGNPDGTVTVTGTVQSVSFFWECFNNGGNHPKATNKGIVEVPVPGPISDTFQIDKNGNVTGSLGPFSASVDGSFCPSGQETHVFAVFNNINLADNVSPPHTLHLDSVTTDTIIY